MKFFKAFIRSALKEYQHRVWLLYLPVTILILILSINKYIDPNHWDFILSGFILAIHEAGHGLFSFFGGFWSILGGSLVEAAFPILFVLYFVLHKRYYDAAFCFIWLAYAFFEIGTYMLDAQVLALPLVTDGILPKIEAHDWYNIFSMLGLLDKSVLIGNMMHILAYFTLSTALGLAVWLQIVMILGSRASNLPQAFKASH